MTPSTRAALQQLAVTFLGACIIASLALVYAKRVRAEMEAPAVEVPLPVEAPTSFDAAWDGIPVPPFKRGVNK